MKTEFIEIIRLSSRLLHNVCIFIAVVSLWVSACQAAISSPAPTLTATAQATTVKATQAEIVTPITAPTQSEPTVLPSKSFEELKSEFIQSEEFQRELDQYVEAMYLTAEDISINEEIYIIKGHEYRFLVVTPDLTKLTELHLKYGEIFKATPLFFRSQTRGWQTLHLKELGRITDLSNGTRLGGYGFAKEYDFLVRVQEEFFNTGMVSFNFRDFSNDLTLSQLDKYHRSDIDIGRRNNMEIIGHNLIWPKVAPSNSNILAYLNWISQTIRKYPEVSTWEVVNEPFDKGPFRLTNENIIEMFETARRANPIAKLVLNNYANHSLLDPNYPNGSKTAETNQLVTLLGKEIDAVGVQMILFANDLPAADDVVNTLRSYEKPVIATEFQIIMTGIQGSQEERMLLQGLLYYTYTKALLDSGVVDTIVFFNQSDRVSPFENEPNLPGYSSDADPTLFDDNFLPKPGYFGALAAEYSYFFHQ